MPDTNYHEITLDKALSYISDFIIKYESDSRNISIGGSFSRDTLKKAGVMDTSMNSVNTIGTILFENYGNNSGTEKLTAGVKQVADYDPASKERYHLPDIDEVYFPDENFVFTEDESSPSAVMNFLSNQNSQISPQGNSSAYGDTKRYEDMFMSKYPENQYPYSFFSGFTVNDLLNQKDSSGNIVSVDLRYFWGYDSGLSINKIRMILFATDSKGQNILEIDGIPAKIIERGGPPDFSQV